MIKSEREYQNVTKKLLVEKKNVDEARVAIELEVQDEKIVNELMAPLETFYEQLKFELDQYEAIKSGNINMATSFNEVGKQLIALRIAMGITQTELALRLSVSEALVSRDEKNEYFNVGTEKLDSILKALGVMPKISMELPIEFQQEESQVSNA